MQLCSSSRAATISYLALHDYHDNNISQYIYRNLEQINKSKTNYIINIIIYGHGKITSIKAYIELFSTILQLWSLESL